VNNATDIEERIQQGFAELSANLHAGLRKIEASERLKIRAQAQEARDRSRRIIQDAHRAELEAASQEQAIG
jgi:hypothetical protein